MSDAAPLCRPPRAAAGRPRLALPAGTCDTHVHIVGATGPETRYPLDARRNYTPVPCSLAQYRQVMDSCGIACAVLVQPSIYGTDNSQLLDALIEGADSLRGVVVLAADVSDEAIAAMHAVGVRGLRLNLVNPQMVALDDVIAQSARVAALGWHLQLQLRGDDAGAALLEHVAERTALPLVIDHFGRPPGLKPPLSLLRFLANGRAYVKLSAPYRLGAVQAAAVLRLVHAYVEANPERVLWASDWPHTELFDVDAPADAELVDALGDWLPDATLLQQVCVANPANLYGFPAFNALRTSRTGEWASQQRPSNFLRRP